MSPQDEHSASTTGTRSERYEIEPRPLPVGGGWRIHFFGRDLETGQEIETGGGVIPIQDGQDEKDAYADAIQTGQEWLQAQEDSDEAR